MINFQVFGVVHHLRLLREIEWEFEQRIAWTGAVLQNEGQDALIKSGVPYLVSDTDRQRIDGSLKYSTQLADQLELQPVHDRVNLFRRRLTANILSLHDFFSEVRALRETFEQNLNFKYFYRYPQAKALLLLRCDPDWDAVTKAFPDCKDDVKGAVDCYALEQNTASVFHSMRVAEHGLRALAKERKIRLPKDKPMEWGTWQDIIRELDDEIKVIAGKKAGKAKDAALEFYSGARADLNGFKDEYRNLVMHVRARYDELQALRALRKVQEFMQRLSVKIDHRHHRIRWGLK